jgi:hypothetical protein
MWIYPFMVEEGARRDLRVPKGRAAERPPAPRYPPLSARSMSQASPIQTTHSMHCPGIGAADSQIDRGWATSESESDLFTRTIHGNTDCYLQFCAARLPQGAVSGRVSAAARVRPAFAGLSLGRLAPVTPTCLLVATSLLSIYRYSKSFAHYSRRPHAPPSPGRHPVVSSYLAGAAFAVPRCHCTVVVVVADRFAAAGAPSRSSPLPTSSSPHRSMHAPIAKPSSRFIHKTRVVQKCSKL